MCGKAFLPDETPESIQKVEQSWIRSFGPMQLLQADSAQVMGKRLFQNLDWAPLH